MIESSFLRRALLLTLLVAATPSHATDLPPPSEPRPVVSGSCIGAEDDHDEVVRDLRVLYMAQQFAELDARLACLMRDPKRFRSGKTGSSAVYGMFRRHILARGVHPQEVATLNRTWREQVPDSIFAEFAEHRLRYAMAWRSRGTSAAHDVTAAGWKDFRQWLVDTEHGLLQARKELRQTPLWHNLMLATVLDMSDGRAKAAVVFEEAVKQWPAHYDFYEVALTRLVPRWGGSWGQVDAFIDRWSDRRRSSEGHSLYARLYASVVADGASPHETRLDWPRMKRGLDDLIARYPDPVHKNLAASFACAYDDRAYLEASLRRIAPHESRPAVWIEGTDPVTCAR